VAHNVLIGVVYHTDKLSTTEKLNKQAGVLFELHVALAWNHC